MDFFVGKSLAEKQNSLSRCIASVSVMRTVSRGILQGRALSLLLWMLVVDDFLKKLRTMKGTEKGRLYSGPCREVAALQPSWTRHGILSNEGNEEADMLALALSESCKVIFKIFCQIINERKISVEDQ